MFRSTMVLCIILCLTACGNDTPGVKLQVQSSADTPILIRDASVFYPSRLELIPAQDVLIQDGKIDQIAAAGSITAPANASIIQAQGQTLLPGLIDMHAHINIPTGPPWEFAFPDPEANLRAYLYAGVTTVFDPGDSSDDAYQRRAATADGSLLGPRIYTAGRIVTHPHGHPRTRIQELAPWWIRWYLEPRIGSPVANETEAQAVVNERADAGADAIKIVIDQIPLDAASLNTELSSAIVKQAAQRGLRTVAHIGTTDDALAAADAGVAMWIHGVYKERIPDELISKLVAYNIPMIPTSEVFDRYGRTTLGPIKPTKLERETVPNSVLTSFYPLPDDFDPGPFRSWGELMATTIDVRRDNVTRLHQAGMLIFAGSDAQSGVFPGASLHRELNTLVGAGMSPAEVIRAATSDPAKYLTQTQSPEFGVMRIGAQADLLLVDGDPTQDIRQLAEIREVITGGRRIKRQALTNPAL